MLTDEEFRKIVERGAMRDAEGGCFVHARGDSALGGLVSCSDDIATLAAEVTRLRELRKSDA